MSAALWCKEHVPAKTIVHQMSDIVNKEGLNALQLYARNFKQADKSVTDTVRKANTFATATKGSSGLPSTGQRRSSTVAPTTNGTANHRHGGDADGVEAAQSLGIRICVTCGIDVSPKWWSVDDQGKPLANGYHDDLGAEAQKFVEQRRFQCHKCHKTNRKPKSLRAPPPSPPPPPSEQAPMTMAGHHMPSSPTQAVASLASLASSPRMRLSERDPEYRSYPWVDRPAAHHLPHPGGPPITAPHSQPPPPPHSQPPQSAHVGHINGSSSMTSVHQYPTAVPYNDWHSRPSTQHGSPGRQMNGEPPLQPSPMTGLSALRPPPLSAPPPHPPALSAGPPGGHSLAQSVLNGLPPSPRRAGGPPPASASPYAHPYHPHHSHPPVPHGLPNGTPPQPPPASLPPRAPDQHSQGFLQQRVPYGPPHASPPMSMDGPPPPRPPENRSAGGASASPSLKNLLI